jgi:cytidyltransferase-like protein
MAKTVFVSGCYDVLHAGHVEFFRLARELGDRLAVSVASDESLMRHKHRLPAMPEKHRLSVVRSIRFVDEARLSTGSSLGLDFLEYFEEVRPAYLAVTTDDQYADMKRQLCAVKNCEYVVLPKVLDIEPISATQIRRRASAPSFVPVRVDFAGGWLDYVRASQGREGYVVNCSISPFVRCDEWPYKVGAGIGGSAAWRTLLGDDSFKTEWLGGRGWQDPAVVIETGLCVWRAGLEAGLVFKRSPYILQGLMALLWSGDRDPDFDPALIDRDYDAIIAAGEVAAEGVQKSDVSLLQRAVDLSYEAQLAEGMVPLPEAPGAARKYCGAGWGGYSVYLFDAPDKRARFIAEHHDAVPIEPFMRFMNFASEIMED